ncbi:hypothetical protein [Cohnella thailandensis]|uniref:Uncharacterized protein n=1 Tax=Cohnella thailandensis TaxID=557557 RepID=A0A841T256_9BACL|nr:hypothetical protein [Cohnella thailandensis]MBB6638234.1 hypothetical protein [Cohnella thailandensis]MBP1977795.1 membrane protein DedA with SNARE-associated domain [Cohnella thailandensis]
MNSSDTGAGDLYEMMTYLILVIISMIVMVAWLKRKAKRKRRNDGG